MRKSSSLQFHIELTDSDEVMRSAARHKHQLPPATAIAALSEPLDTLEESLAAQVGGGCSCSRRALDCVSVVHSCPCTSPQKGVPARVLVCVLADAVHWFAFAECLFVPTEPGAPTKFRPAKAQ
jgi:hypothetical protein